MENKPHAFWAGLFTIALTGAIVLTVFFFSADRTVRVPYDLIATSNVTGLSSGAAVRYRGLDVGRVQSIAFDRDKPGEIRIRVLIDERAPITRSTFATLALQGVTGTAFVQLDDTGRDLSPLKSSEKEIAQIPMHPGLLDQLQRRGDALLRRFDQIADEVDDLLSDDNRKQMVATIQSLHQAADGVSTLTRQLGPTVNELPGAVASLHRSLDSANRLVANLNRPDGPFITNLNKAGDAAQEASKALTSLDGSISDLSARLGYETLPRVNSLTDDVRSAMRSVDRAAGTFSANPRSVLFGGAPQPAPGPGEPGFAWPAAPAGR
ncbi:MAG TPA: MlaD family protein [Paraburkholderia sp.]